MLGKLFKHEFKETAKTIVPLLGALVIVTILGCISMGTGQASNSNSILAMITVLLMVLYILGLFAIGILIVVALVSHYYKTMFSARGYLTHTLPVSEIALINTKLVTAVVWLFATGICFFISVFAIVCITSAANFDVFDVQQMMQEFQSIFNLSFLRIAIEFVLMMILGCFTSMLMFYASMTIGQLFEQHRILGSVLAFICFYIIMQVLSFVVLGFSGYFSMIGTTAVYTTPAETGSFMHRTMLSSFIQVALTGGIYYAICVIITKKKLNLE